MPATPVEDSWPDEYHPKSAIKTGHFQITAKSVLYRREGQVATCYVVLDILFDFDTNIRLKYADVSLKLKAYEDITSATTSANVTEQETILDHCCVRDHFPDRLGEIVIIEEHVVDRNISLKPNIEVSIPALATLKIGGVGVEGKGRPTIEKRISAVGCNHDNDMQVKWVFDNEHKTIFPKTIRVLVIVRKTANDKTLWFKFALKLESFQVKVFGTTFTSALRTQVQDLFAQSPITSPQPIPIKGRWEEGIAKKAIDDMDKFRSHEKIPEEVGLRAAMRPYMNPMIARRNDTTG